MEILCGNEESFLERVDPCPPFHTSVIRAKDGEYVFITNEWSFRGQQWLDYSLGPYIITYFNGCGWLHHWSRSLFLRYLSVSPTWTRSHIDEGEGAGRRRNVGNGN